VTFEAPALFCLLFAQSALGALCDPAYADAIGRGDRHHAAFEYEAAARAYAEALDADPGGFHALDRLADVSNDLGDFTGSLGYAQCLREAHPQRPEGAYWAGVAYGQLTTTVGPGEKLALARDIVGAAGEAIRIDPGFGPAHVVLGAFHREMSQIGFFARFAARAFLGGLPEASLAESERLLRRAVELEPGSVVARYELALTLAAAKRDEDARAAFAFVVASLPQEASDRDRQLRAAAWLAERRRSH
jgi:tetratricopeptide (TPR) repeat protein